jgi:hypothetical protein
MTGTRRVEYMALTDVQPAVRNPKRHATQAIAASIDRFGLGELPLLDERTGRLVAGHGRLDQLAAMRRAGQDPPDGVKLAADGNWLVPITRGWASRSDAEAEAYLVASNQLTVKGGWDQDALVDLLGELDEELVELAGFDERDLAKLLGGGDTLPTEGDADTDEMEPVYGVIITCVDEQEQVHMLKVLSEQGYNVRALMG